MEALFLKKTCYSNLLPLIVSIAGVVGFVLRLWTLGGGPEAEGLYAAAPVAWILLWILTAAVPVVTVILCRPLSETGKYLDNFPASPISAVGALLAALAIAISSVGRLTDSQTTITFLAGVIGLLAAAGMGVVGYSRLKGRKPIFFCHAAVCLFFAFDVFDMCRAWSNETQTGVFILSFLARLSVMLAAYHLCAFDVDLGKRKPSLLWSLLSVYLCLVALADAKDIWFYGGLALWLMTNLCSLRPIKKRRATNTPAPNPVQAQMSSNDVSIDELNSWLEE